MITTGIVKVAWIRDRSYPPGMSAPGKLNCQCGSGPTTPNYKPGPDITCQCGVTYTWNGWIVSEMHPLRRQLING